MPPARSLRADDHPECRSGGPPCLGRRTAMRARQRSWTTPGTLSISRGGAGFRRGGPWGRGRRRLWTAWVTALVLAISFLPATVWPTTAPRAKAATTCGAGCHVTVNGLDFSSGAALTSFNFIVNVDNSKLPSDPLSLSTESNSPIVATGDQDHRTVTLPEGRYLISMRSLDHKMWGNYITLPGDADASGNLTINMELTTQSADNPLPLGKIRVFVFNDNAWTNGAPDTEEAGLGGFKAGLVEQTDSEVSVDYNNNTLCHAGNTPGSPQYGCITSADGFLEINDLGPATYFISVTPPDGPCNGNPNSQWYQTTT